MFAFPCHGRKPRQPVLSYLPVSRLSTLLNLLLLVLLLTACSGQGARHEHEPARGQESALRGQAPAAQAPAAFPAAKALPSPQTLGGSLIPARSASYVPADLLREGEAFVAALPKSNAVVNGSSNGVLLSPQPGTGGISGAAFATYNFVIPGYGGNAAITPVWHTTPAEGQSFVALANWEDDRWDSFGLPASGALELASLDDYFDFGGNLLACVLVVGGEPADLDSLRIGSLPPIAMLTAQPAFGITPFEVDFDASASTDPDGTIVKYEWDTDGDGTFEISTGDTPTYEHNYETEGIVQAAVRTTDDQGVYAEAGLEVRALESGGFSFGSASGSDIARSILAAANGDLLLFSEVDSPTGDTFAFCRVSNSGEEVFNKQWTSGFGSQSLAHAALGPNGSIYTCGSVSASSITYGLLQEWSQDGELLRSRLYSLADSYISFEGLAFNGDSVFVCGSLYLTTISRYLSLLMRFDLEGNFGWAKTIIAADHSLYKAMLYRQAAEFNQPELFVCGYLYQTVNDTDATYATYDVEGDRHFFATWGGDSRDDDALAITLAGPPGEQMVFVGGRSFQSDYTAFLVREDGVSMTYDYFNTSGFSLRALRGRIGGLDLLFGGTYPGANMTVLARAGTDLSISEALQLDSAPDGSVFGISLTPYAGSGSALLGNALGALPLELEGTVEQNPSALTWEPASPAQGNPDDFTISNITIDLAEFGDYDTNRESDDDTDLYIHISN